MEWDEAKATSNYGTIYVLKYLNSLKSRQLDKTVIDNIILNVIAQSNKSYPTPGRSIRLLCSQLLVRFLSSSSSSKSFISDISTQLFEVLESNNSTSDVKSAVYFVLSDVISHFGKDISSLAIDIYQVSLKTFKNSNNNTHLRYQSALYLGNFIEYCPNLLRDNQVKDLLKVFKSNLTDKSFPVRRISAKCLIHLSVQIESITNLNEIEAIVNICVKNSDNLDKQTRQKFVSLVSQLLASTQSKKIVETKPTTKKKNNNKDDDNDDQQQANVQIGLINGENMLMILSNHFNKQGNSRYVRNTILEIYATTFLTLGSEWVESNYLLILNHLLNNIMSGPFSTNSKHNEQLTIYSNLMIIIRDVIGKTLLSDQGRGMALRVIIENILSKYSKDIQTLPSTNISDRCLVISIEECVDLMIKLNNLPVQIQEKFLDLIYKLISHPSYSVQISSASLFRQYHELCPINIEQSLSKLFELLEKKLAYLRTPSAPPDVALVSIGYTLASSSLLGLFKVRPLNIPIEMPYKAFEISQKLLKDAIECEFDQASIHIQVAWIIIDSLMCIGPQFVSSIQSQLMLLWKNSLSKLDQNANPKSQIEWTFLIHIRECALTALLNFLKFNQNILNLDSLKKINMMLFNTLYFSHSFSNAHNELLKEQMPTGACSHPNIGLIDRDILLKRRLFQCMMYIDSNVSSEVLSTFVDASFNAFGDPECYAGSAAQATIAAASTGSFSSIWSVGDGYNYGVTSLHELDHTFVGPETIKNENEPLTERFMKTILRPSPLSYEHDVLTLFKSNNDSPSVSPATGLIDVSISFFALKFSDLDASSMISIINNMKKSCKNPKLDRNPGRKTSIFINSLVSILGFLRYGQTLASKLRMTLSVAPIRNTLQELFQDAILCEDSSIRRIGSECLGRLIAITNDRSFMTSQSRYYIDLIVDNRDPYVRSGSAKALSQIYKNVGGLVAGALLNTIVDILTSLASDSHPEVHYYSLESLCDVIEAAGSSYSQYVARTLGLLTNVHTWISHEPEGGQTVNSTNLRSNLSNYKIACKILNVIIGVLGPEVNELTEIRELLFLLVKQMMKESDDDLVKVNALKSLHHFVMFTPTHTDIPTLIKTFQVNMKSKSRNVQLVSISGLYQLSQKYVDLISKIGGDSLVKDIFALYNTDPTIDGIKLLVLSWLKQTSEVNANGWLDIFQNVFTKPSNGNNSNNGSKEAKNSSMVDEEVQELGIENDNKMTITSGWNTQLFSLECVHVLLTNSNSSNYSQIICKKLSSRVSDLIRLAFVASTSHVEKIRLRGLIILQDVIDVFANQKDPHDENSSLLEQHQAPITAALTPAFSSDSTPDILAIGIHVCAVFVRSGIIQDISKMGRILKLLTNTLTQFKDSSVSIIGEVKNLCDTAKSMIKLATLTAWSELAIASTSKKHLDGLLEPFWQFLIPMWAETLQQFAEMSEGIAYDDVLTQQILLPYYENDWLKILQAFVTSLNNQSDYAHQFVQLDGYGNIKGVKFQIIYGLAFSILAEENINRNDERALIAILTLKSLMKISYSNFYITDENIFSELLSLIYRLTTTETLLIRSASLNLLSDMCKIYGGKLLDNIEIPESPDLQFGKSLPVNAKLTMCLRLVYSILDNCLDDNAVSINSTMENRAQLAKYAFNTFLDVSETFAATTRVELFALVLHKLAGLLKTESGYIHIMAQLLPCLKNIIERSNTFKGDDADILHKVIHGFLSLTLQIVDETKSREASLVQSKRKYNMLATVIVLTKVPSQIVVSKECVQHCCDIIIDSLFSQDQLSSVVVNSIKNISQNQDNSIILKYANYYLLMEFSSRCKNDKIENEECLKEIFNFFELVSDSNDFNDYRIELYNIIITTCVTYLHEEKYKNISIETLLKIASKDAAAFKTVTNLLNEDQKSLLEITMREAILKSSSKSPSNANNNIPSKQQPSISLKSFS